MFFRITIDVSLVRPGSRLQYQAQHGDWFTVQSAKEPAIQASLRRRVAYPGTFCERNPDGSILLGYGGGSKDIDSEFLRIELRADGSLLVERDVYCTLPIYYGYDGEHLIASDDYAVVLAALKRRTINTGVLCEYLFHLTPPTPRALYKEIGILGERQTLFYKDGVLLHQAASPRSWTYNAELARTNGQFFPTVLDERFDHFIHTRLDNNAVGYELSGGLDSAFLPLYMARKGLQKPAPAGTVIQADPADQARQLQKITELESRTLLRSKRVFLDPAAHYPLAKNLRTPTFRPFNLTHELYEATASEVAEHLVEQGVTVAVTGSGGDQLLEHRPHPSQQNATQHAALSTLAPFFTKACKPIPKRLEASHMDEYTPTLLSHSIQQDTLILSERYIAMGIWPVSPFHDVQLYNFCQALPIQYRANKNVFRAYFEAGNFPEQLYRGPNEDFGKFFDTCFLAGTYDTLVSTLARHSVTEKLGYVDTEKLTSYYADIRQGKASADMAFAIYTWMVAELNLQAVA